MTRNNYKPAGEKMIPQSEFDQKMKQMEELFNQKFRELEERSNLQPSVVTTLDVPEERTDVRLDDYIEVLSLCPMPLNLSTEGNGRGRLFRFSKFGDKKSILYRDLVDIIENHRSFLEAGFFYILNPFVIRKNGLDDVYERILTKEKIVEIINGDKNTIALYETANERQREMIVEMILQKLHEDPDSVDMNLIDKISKISKIDLIAKINFSRELLDENKDE